MKIEGLLLNPKEVITVIIVLAGDKSSDNSGMIANALIVDGKFVKRHYKKPLRKPPQWWTNSMIFLGFCLFVALASQAWGLSDIVALVTFIFAFMGIYLIPPKEDDYPLLIDISETAEAMKVADSSAE